MAKLATGIVTGQADHADMHNDERAIINLHQVGTGAPNGAVTGSPGDRYIDTAATLGARVWYKATGVDTDTGWKVAEGDTGWRNITSLLINGWALGSGVTAVFLRRVNDTVEIYVDNGGELTGAAKTGDSALAAINGFRAAGAFSYVRRRVSGDAFWSGSDTLVAAGVSGAILIAGVWTTTDDWPSALPGTTA